MVTDVKTNTKLAEKGHINLELALLPAATVTCGAKLGIEGAVANKATPQLTKERFTFIPGPPLIALDPEPAPVEPRGRPPTEKRTVELGAMGRCLCRVASAPQLVHRRGARPEATRLPARSVRTTGRATS